MSAGVVRVQRYCFVRLTEERSAQRDALARTLRAELSALCGPLPVWVGVPGDDSAARWDLSIVIGAPDLATWQAIAASDGFEALMARLAAESAVVKAWTFSAP